MSGDLFAIDPGTTESGWCVMRGRRVTESGIWPNDRLLERLLGISDSRLAIEWVENFGMPVGRELFVTVRWIGRFAQAWHDPEAVVYVPRREVKLHLCRTMKAKDPHIRQALLDLIGPQGTKRQPGPLYGVRSHAWSAVAVAATVLGLTPMFDGPAMPEVVHQTLPAQSDLAADGAPF